MARTGSTKTLEHMFRFRWWILGAAGICFLVALWFLLVEVLVQTRAGERWLHRARDALGLWLRMDDALKSMIGLSPAGPLGTALLAGTGLAVFLASLLLFLRPRPGWARDLARIAPLDPLAAASGGFMAAILTAGVAAALLEAPSWWSGLAAYHWWLGSPQENGVALSAQFIAWAAIFLPAWGAWSAFIRRRFTRRAGSDRYWQTVAISYCLFVASGLVLLVTGLIHSRLFAFEGPYWKYGTYTAMCMSLTTLLWSGAGGVVLLFLSRRYHRCAAGLCLACGYDLRGTAQREGTTCPECGARVGAVARLGGRGEEDGLKD